MNLKDIKTVNTFEEVWMIPLAGDAPSAGAIGRLKATDAEGIYNFFTGAKPALLVKLRDIELSLDLNFHLKRGCAHLAEVIQIMKDGSAMFKIVFFRDRAVEMDTVEVCIDKKIEDTVKRRERLGATEEITGKLRDKCVISDGKNTWFIIKTSPAGETDYSDKPEDETGETPEGMRNVFAFSICGEGVSIPVEKRKLSETDEIFFATKIVYNNSNNDVSSFYLAGSGLVFSENAKRMGEFAAGALRNIEIQENGYLAAWDKYGETEEQLLLQKAKDVGIITYSKVERVSASSFRITLDKEPPEALSDTDSLEFVSNDNLPLYLTNPDMDWKEYSEIRDAEYEKMKESKKADVEVQESDEDPEDENNAAAPAPGKAKEKNIVCKIFRINEKSIVVSGLDYPPPLNLNLILSIRGDLIQYKRQTNARENVKTGRAANPLLGLIIEEGIKKLPQTGQVPHIEPLSTFVKEKIFKNRQTDIQIEAVDIALNTPDIAIIQGPPGTGKTTVVAAIIERLNEVYNKKNPIRGKILVTGFQHDAVENIISRLSVNSLPAVKFGNRPGESEESENITGEKLRQWAEDIIEKIEDPEKNPQIKSTADQLKLQVLLRNYGINPAKSVAESILELILSLPRDIITADIVEKAESLHRSLQSETVISDENVNITAAIRALRSTKKTFEDDGSRNAMRLLVLLRDSLSAREVAVLQAAAGWKDGEPIPFLKDIADLQDSLLSKYNVPAVFSIDKPRQEIIDLIAKVNAAFLKKKGGGGKKDEILAGFINELKTNPEGIREAVEEYCFVYAATTQGSMGKKIIKAKTQNPSDFVRYDTVIIDEAARVSPRDLLIPMVQAEKRIILVGDHRQLPHIVDDEIIRKAQKTVDSSDASDDVKVSDQFERFIKYSMFEYLKGRLEILYANDEMKIERTKTLDKQFRMHKELGDFVSKYFYEEPSKGREKFESPPTDEEYFRHNLPGLDGPMLWMDIPNIRGPEGKIGISRVRRIEAEAIAGQLKKWIDSEAGRSLTFGVISFYRAQSDLIFEELGKDTIGITEKDYDDKSWKIKEEYKYVEKHENGKAKKEERLRVGTVDAFQGMEFDVVFLSMVRTRKDIPGANATEKEKEHTFGRLVLPNLLCVSMSRQKKALVVAGDAKLAGSPVCKEAVPALYYFREMCAAKGKIHEYR